MKKIDLRNVLDMEQITVETFRNCERRDQFMILLVRPEFRDLFLEIHGPFSRVEEFELIMNHMLACEDAAHKDEFTGNDIARFIIEGVLRTAEFEKMKYAERLNGHDWSGILAETDPEGVWKDYCDFSRNYNSDWLNLLTFRPEYAVRCPFEKLEQTDIDILIREQPELADWTRFISGRNG